VEALRVLRDTAPQRCSGHAGVHHAIVDRAYGAECPNRGEAKVPWLQKGHQAQVEGLRLLWDNPSQGHRNQNGIVIADPARNGKTQGPNRGWGPKVSRLRQRDQAQVEVLRVLWDDPAQGHRHQDGASPAVPARTGKTDGFVEASATSEA